MKSIPAFVFTAAAAVAGLFLAPMGAMAQKPQATTPTPPATGSTKLNLKDPKAATAPGAGKLEDVSLDPAGKLPGANKEELAPLPPMSDKGSSDPSEMHPAVKRLAKDQQDKFNGLKDEATNFMRTVRLQEAMEKLIEAEKIVGEPLPDVENLRGALYTKMKDFDNARKHFHKSLALLPDSFHPRFNLAELDFVEKKWEPAVKSFSELVKVNEKNKITSLAKVADEDQKEQLGASYDGTTRLMQFKIYICQLQLKQDAEAKETAKNFKQNDFHTPVFYFSNAAACFIKDDKDGAEEWLTSAKNIYPASINEIYIDSLVEMGWLQGLQ